jgi:hypothetical protein
MDGWFLVSNIVQTPLTTPFMTIRSDTPDYAMPDGRPDDGAKFPNHGAGFLFPATDQQRALEISITSFSKIKPPTSDAYIKSGPATSIRFFDKHLRNEDNHLLDGPSLAYPEVV